MGSGPSGVITTTARKIVSEIGQNISDHDPGWRAKGDHRGIKVNPGERVLLSYKTTGEVLTDLHFLYEAEVETAPWNLGSGFAIPTGRTADAGAEADHALLFEWRQSLGADQKLLKIEKKN